jgi:hypothetical protein
MNSSVFIAEEQRPDLMARVARECWRMAMILEEMESASPAHTGSSPFQAGEEGPDTDPEQARGPED